jgi:hypothetical protein
MRVAFSLRPISLDNSVKDESLSINIERRVWLGNCFCSGPGDINCFLNALKKVFMGQPFASRS